MDSTPAVKKVASRSRRYKETADETRLVPDRRHNILLAAEQLFAAHGYHGVSIRDIADAAGVPLALVGYYFGPKAKLYEQIYRERSAYVQVRIDALKKIKDTAPSGDLLEEIVKAFALPVLDFALDTDGRNFLRMISRSVSDQIQEDEAIVREFFDPLAHAFIDAMHTATPHVSRGMAAWCYQFALGSLLLHVNDKRIERLSFGENPMADFKNSGPILIQFITAGIRGVCNVPLK